MSVTVQITSDLNDDGVVDQLDVDISDAGDFVRIRVRTRKLACKRLQTSEHRNNFVHFLSGEADDRGALVGKKTYQALGRQNFQRFPQRRPRHSELVAQT